ncbi:MAG: hypothetical protein ACTHKQ_05740 [Mesorhizobium sp.]
MAIKPVRSVTKTITPSGANLILIDDGTSMGKATLLAAVEAVEGPMVDEKIDALDLDTASQKPIEFFATAEQGTKADNAAPKTIAITGAGLASGGGTLEDSREISVSEASDTEAFEHTADSVVLTPRRFPALIQGRDAGWGLRAFNQGAGLGNESADSAALTSALASGEQNIIVDAKTFKIAAGTYNMVAGQRLSGMGRFASILKCYDTTLNRALIKPTHNCELRDFWLRGPQDTISAYLSGQKGVGDFSESDLPARMSVQGMRISGWADCGIHVIGDRDGKYHHNWVHNCGRMGARFTGGLRTSFNFNNVYTIAPGSGGNSPAINAYGVSFSHDGATTGFEKPTDIQCFGNVIRDIPSWEGIDCHSVDGFDVSHNTILDTMLGIYLGPSSGSNNTNARRHRCIGNHIETTATYRRQGIVVIPSASGYSEGNGRALVVTDNIIIGHGLNQALYDAGIGITTGAALTIAYADHASVKDNSIHSWNYAAIELLSNMNGGEVSGNEIGDGTATNGILDAIRVSDPTTISATVGRNTIRRTSGSMTGIRVSGSAGSGAFGPRIHKQNMIGVPTPLASGSYALMHPESTIEIDGSSTQNIGNITAGGMSVDIAITVTGAAVGDKVANIYRTGTEDLVVVDARVSAANTVSFKLRNPTGSDIDPASQTYTALVTKRGKQ